MNAGRLTSTKVEVVSELYPRIDSFMKNKILTRTTRFEGGNEKSKANPLLVDELDLLESKEDTLLSETARLQASNVQRSVIDRLGVQGDKALLGRWE